VRREHCIERFGQGCEKKLQTGQKDGIKSNCNQEQAAANRNDTRALCSVAKQLTGVNNNSVPIKSAGG